MKEIKSAASESRFPSWVQDALEAIERKCHIVAERNSEIIPYTTHDGHFDDQIKSNICWWTNGFWGGMMWQLYTYSGKELYRKIAIANEEKLDENLLNPYGMDHDSGFKWLPTATAHYKLDGNECSLHRGLLAAENLAGRFNPAGNFIRAWNDANDGSAAGTAIIDCMMNLPLLYWASDVTKDPRFAQIAVRHADTTQQYFIREDGSAIHIGKFDPVTGRFLHSVGGQGYAEGSSWTRGQAWALYGFTLSALHTGDVKYLDTAKRVADYFISQMSERGGMGIPIDFAQPTDCRREDSSAAAIAACGLLELCRAIAFLEENRKFDNSDNFGFVKKEDCKNNSGNSNATDDINIKYKKAAVQLLEFLCKNRLNLEEDKDYLLENCADCFHSNQEQMTLIYADYFLIEALLKLQDRDLFIW